MAYRSVVVSSGHGRYVRGAAGSPIPPCLDEVDEARKVVDCLREELKARNVTVKTYHDDVSRNQSENLRRIVDFHNSQTRDLDISVHFNAYDGNAHGVEVLYVTQQSLAAKVSSAIAGCGFTNRGAKKRTDLYFLNETSCPAILIETAFCDNVNDANIYRAQFNRICDAIADVLGGAEEGAVDVPPATEALFEATGKCSTFGGPEDVGVSESEGLAFISDIDQAPHLFLPYQPEDTSGLARRLNPNVAYVACRWVYDDTPKPMMLQSRALVTNLRTGLSLMAYPADWGPNINTGRVADLSPSLAENLGVETDDEVKVLFPYRG